MNFLGIADRGKQAKEISNAESGLIEDLKASTKNSHLKKPGQCDQNKKCLGKEDILKEIDKDLTHSLKLKEFRKFEEMYNSVISTYEARCQEI
ncbi:hypothetical protein JTE90_025039 [Oedothorax gibbosus]|uniref:Uncharacterized protein n=1 Tax=Oedothorax gibbosus TaxID=931172 RepID=A0AAV6TIG8_9ARAC|nr:hypothetical protein JTE90_025039 [Oedothorax gibbosus]